MTKQWLRDIATELDILDERLQTLATDDYNARIDLRQERQELLAEASRLRKELPIDREALEAELAELQGRADELRKQRVDPVKQAGGGSGGGDFGFAGDAWRLNRHIDAALGLDGIMVRIAQIEQRLGG